MKRKGKFRLIPRIQKLSKLSVLLFLKFYIVFWVDLPGVSGLKMQGLPQQPFLGNNSQHSRIPNKFVQLIPQHSLAIMLQADWLSLIPQISDKNIAEFL
jgi:hypothetical protein